MGTSWHMAGIGKAKSLGHTQRGSQVGWWKNEELQYLLLFSQSIRKHDHL